MTQREQIDRCDRWGPLLTLAESAALLDEVDHWCRRTGTNYTKLVVAAGVNVSTRYGTRILGRRITPKVAGRLRLTMQQYRYGISREEYRAKPKPWGAVVARLEHKTAEMMRVEPLRVSNETCGRCGARAGRCEHTILSGMDTGSRVFA